MRAWKTLMTAAAVAAAGALAPFSASHAQDKSLTLCWAAWEVAATCCRAACAAASRIPFAAVATFSWAALPAVATFSSAARATSPGTAA